MAISPETAATTRSIFSMLSRTPRRSTSTPWTLRGHRKRQPSSTRTTERPAKQEESGSPLTDSNRRPPLYEEGPRVKRWLLRRPVKASALGCRGELGSSLYRLLVGGHGRLEFAPVAHLLRDRQAARGSVAPLGAKGCPRVSMCQIASVSRRARSIWATLAPRCLPMRAFVSV